MDETERLAALLAVQASLSGGERLATRREHITGRLIARRAHGSILFLDLQCSGSILMQLVVEAPPGANEQAPSAARVAPIGSLIRASGQPGKTNRGQPSLFVEALNIKILEGDACDAPGVSPTLPPPVMIARAEALACRFQFTPDNVRWGSKLQLLRVGAFNSLSWRGGLPLPTPPSRRGESWGSCWLLPATDDTALAMAKQQDELRAAGWRLLTCAPEIILRLGDKARLQAHAASLGLADHLPASYGSLAAACYPAVLKRARGQFGKGVHIVASAQEARRRMGMSESGLGTEWILQELVQGRVESSASLLVSEGKILRALLVEYTYSEEAYVWPQVREDKAKRRARAELEPDHQAALESLLAGFSGVCNANFKVRAAGGRLALFEFNTRPGADLACDAPRPLAAAFLEHGHSLASAIEARSPRMRTSPPPLQPLAPTAEDSPCGNSVQGGGTPLPSDTRLKDAERGQSALPTRDADSSVVYLSDCRDESPRYASMRDAPNWLRDSLHHRRRPPFVLRGASSAALRAYLPKGHPAAASRGLATGEAARAADAEGMTGWPTAVVCPGGGYETLAPHEAAPAAKWLASLGFVAFVLRYRLPPDHPWPAARDDARAALHYLCSDDAKARWQLDVSRLILLGFSAGAHLAAHAICPQLRAVVLIYPAVADATDEAVRTTEVAKEQAALVGGRKLPAVYVVASTNDRICSPREHGDFVVDELKNCGLHCTYQRQKLGSHGFGVTRKWALPCCTWLREQVLLPESQQ